MSSNITTSYKNSCVKVPINPVNNQPSPSFEQSPIPFFANNKSDVRESHRTPDPVPRSHKNTLTTLRQVNCKLNGLLKFYDSIPAYNEISHLSNAEFDRKIDNLKVAQRLLLDKETKSKAFKWTGMYKSLGTKKVNNVDAVRLNNEVEHLELGTNSSDSNDVSSRRTIRFGGSAKSQKTSVSSSPNKGKRRGRVGVCPFKSKPSVAWKDDGITVTKPFKMTLRDEDEKIVNDLMAHVSVAETPAPEHFVANPVPISSRIPLFDKIMADQEKRREIVKLNSKLALLSQVKPFSFTKREQDQKELATYLSKSSTDLTHCGRDHSAKRGTTTRSRNFFRNYFHQKMLEDDYYRSLKRKIRAEELLKLSSLPPSMAARVTRSKRNSTSDDCLDSSATKESEKWSASGFFECPPIKFLTTPRPYRLHTAKRGEKRAIEHKLRCSKAHGASSNVSPMESSTDRDMFTNRANLASVLRVMSTKRKIESSMREKLDEQRRVEEERWRAKLLKRHPAWQLLNYNNKEDLAMRLQLRREEEQMRRDEFEREMSLMYDRVQRIPPLFERHTQFPNSELRQLLLHDYLNQLDAKTSDVNDELSRKIAEVTMTDDVRTYDDENVASFNNEK